MGQQADSNRNAALDDAKSRAAGRDQNDAAREAIRDAQSPEHAKGKTAGAFGKEGMANGPKGGQDQGVGGGGGGAQPSTEPGRGENA